MPYSTTSGIPTLEVALNSCTVDQLKQLAALLPDSSVPTRKAELVAYVMRFLHGKALRDMWQRLDRLQKAAVAEVVHGSSDQYSSKRFIAKYREGPIWGKGDRYAFNYKPSLLRLFFYDSWMPQDLKAELKQFVPPPEPLQLPSREETPEGLIRTWRKYSPKQQNYVQVTDEVPVQVRETERIAPHDLQAVLRLVDLGKVTVSDKTFYPNAATLREIAPLLQEGDYYEGFVRAPAQKHYDETEFSQQGQRVRMFTLADVQRAPEDTAEIGPIQPFAWVMLLQAGKLAELSAKRLVLTKAGQKALSDPPAKIIHTLWQRWLKTTFFDELRRIDSIKGQTGKGKRGLTAPASRRKVIVEAMKQCPPGRWVAIAEFLRYLIAAGYEFEVSRYPDNLTLESAFFSYLDPSNTWDILETRYLLCLLFEYMATLGLLDVAYVHPADSIIGSSDLTANTFAFLSRYDGLAYFRLNALGAYCLGLSDRYTPTPFTVQAVLRVLPNLEVVATGRLSPADELLLNAYAQQTSDSVWKLEQGQLLGAIEVGRSVAELQAFLTSRSGEALPETVVQFLKDIGSRTQSLQDLGNARLIQCADPGLAVLIANDSRTKPFCFLADTPAKMGAGQARYLVVPAESETKFRNALRKLGYSLPINNRS